METGKPKKNTFHCYLHVILCSYKFRRYFYKYRNLFYCEDTHKIFVPFTSHAQYSLYLSFWIITITHRHTRTPGILSFCSHAERIEEERRLKSISLRKIFTQNVITYELVSKLKLRCCWSSLFLRFTWIIFLLIF